MLGLLTSLWINAAALLNPELVAGAVLALFPASKTALAACVIRRAAAKQAQVQARTIRTLCTAHICKTAKAF